MNLSDSNPVQSILRGMLILVALSLPPVLHAQWQVTAGAQSTDHGTQALAFLPNEIWVHPGDSITWTFPSDEIHTVTFLSTVPIAEIRPPFPVGCPPGPPPGITPDNSPFDGTTCVNAGPSAGGQTYTVNFPSPGNYKLVCLVHENMTAVVHVQSGTLPHDQAFYDQQAAAERNALLSDTDHHTGNSHSGHSHGSNVVTAGIGEAVATAGGSQSLSIVRFLHPATVVHVGEIVEWTNEDPATPHTITFGDQAGNPIPPSPNVFVDADGARHAAINSIHDRVHSGFIVAAPQERIGLAQAPLGVTRFRITFTHAGTFPYLCVLHDNLGMKGEVIVLP